MNRPIRHVVRSQAFDRLTLDQIFDRADFFRQELDEDPLRPFGELYAKRRCFSFFEEESTRTRNSFEAAAWELGIHCISTANARYSSSLPKGESIEDTIRTLCMLRPSFIIFRHEEDKAALRAAAVSNVPIISGGDGRHQHPTQSLTDLLTIRRELGRIDDLTVAFCGDLANGRTVRSDAYQLLNA